MPSVLEKTMTISSKGRQPKNGHWLSASSKQYLEPDPGRRRTWPSIIEGKRRRHQNENALSAFHPQLPRLSPSVCALRFRSTLPGWAPSHFGVAGAHRCRRHPAPPRNLAVLGEPSGGAEARRSSSIPSRTSATRSPSQRAGPAPTRLSAGCS